MRLSRLHALDFKPVAAIFAALFAGCSDSASPEDSPFAGGNAAAGEPVYEEYCAFCHGASGEGYLADNANALANSEFLAIASDEFIGRSIEHGRPGTSMSAWGAESNGGPLSAEQVADVVALIRSWQTQAPIDLDVSWTTGGGALRGEPVYLARCASCHGDEGEGVTAVSLNNPWFHELASDDFIRQSIVRGRPGTTMEAWSDLSPTAIEDLVAYIRTWRRPPGASAPAPFEPDLESAVLNPGGPAPQFTLREERFVPAAEVLQAMENGNELILLDARPVGDYRTSHITGALNLPFYELDNWLDRLPTDTFIVPYCGCPHAVSGQALNALRAAGFTNNAILDEGFYVWEDSRYPVTYP
jgi:mono/diheme cytochrome c family protein/rhodanese-related sulfurtransferase